MNCIEEYEKRGKKTDHARRTGKENTTKAKSRGGITVIPDQALLLSNQIVTNRWTRPE